MEEGVFEGADQGEGGVEGILMGDEGVDAEGEGEDDLKFSLVSAGWVGWLVVVEKKR